MFQQHRIGREPELSSRADFGAFSLFEHGKSNSPSSLFVNFVHLRVAGEEDECAAAGNVEQFADDRGGLSGELWGAGTRASLAGHKELPGSRSRSERARLISRAWSEP